MKLKTPSESAIARAIEPRMRYRKDQLINQIYHLRDENEKLQHRIDGNDVDLADILNRTRENLQQQIELNSQYLEVSRWALRTLLVIYIKKIAQKKAIEQLQKVMV